MSANGITKITYLNNFAGSPSPARVNRRTGEMFINNSVWKHLTKEARFFILLHEHAHAHLQTTDEKIADAYAWRKYIEAGYSQTESVLALSKILSYTSPEHHERTNLMFNRNMQYDKQVNNNERAIHLIQ